MHSYDEVEENGLSESGSAAIFVASRAFLLPATRIPLLAHGLIWKFGAEEDSVGSFPTNTPSEA
jgi:hypothetical protein